MGVGVGKVVPVIDKSGFSPQNPDFMGKIRVGVGEGVPVIDPLFKVEVNCQTSNATFEVYHFFLSKNASED